MSAIADMVRKLFEKGVDQEAILIAIEAAEQVACRVTERDVTRDVTRDENRRELARIRQQRWRDRVTRDMRDEAKKRNKHIEMTQRDVTRDEKVHLYKESKKEVSKKERGHPSVTSRGHRLPDGWVPSEPDHLLALQKFGPAHAAEEIDKFRDYWRAVPGAKGLKLDWNSTFRNWIRNARVSHGTSSANRSGGSLIDSIKRDLAQLEGSESFDTALPGGPLLRISK